VGCGLWVVVLSTVVPNAMMLMVTWLVTCHVVSHSLALSRACRMSQSDNSGFCFFGQFFTRWPCALARCGLTCSETRNTTKQPNTRTRARDHHLLSCSLAGRTCTVVPLSQPPNKQSFSQAAATLNNACLLRWVLDAAAILRQQQNRMWLPQELAMLVGSYLDPSDLKVCTTQLCSSGAEFVSTGFTNHTTTIRLHELVACCRLPAGVDDVAQECIERMESFLARRGNVRTIILDARLKGECAANASMYSDIHDRLQQGSSFQLSQKPGITVEWHVTAASIAQVAFLLKVDVPQDSACASDSAAGGAIRQYLHTLNLRSTQVSDVSVLASCQNLHTLDLWDTRVSDVSALASCKSLHTLKLVVAKVRDVSGLASCQSLHTLDLWGTQVSDVSVLASCKSLHTLDLACTQVSDVSALASCKSLHSLDLKLTQVSDVSALASCKSLQTLILYDTQVSDVSALASCKSLHSLDLKLTQVSDVSALASCQSLRTLWGVEGMIGASEVLRMISVRGKQQ
jgi:hypothetical protein